MRPMDVISVAPILTNTKSMKPIIIVVVPMVISSYRRKKYTDKKRLEQHYVWLWNEENERVPCVYAC